MKVILHDLTILCKLSALFVKTHCSFSPHLCLMSLPHSSSSFLPCTVIFCDRAPFVSSHSAYRQSWGESHLVFSLFLPVVLPVLSLSLSSPPPFLSSFSLTISPHTLDSFYTLRKHPSFFCSVKENTAFIFMNIFCNFSHSFLILKLDPICFISSWSSWQGPYCWRTTLNTQTHSQCTSKASSVSTKPTPSHTLDRRTTVKHRLSWSTPWSLLSPLWRWVWAQTLHPQVRNASKHMTVMCIQSVQNMLNTKFIPASPHVVGINRTLPEMCRCISSWSCCSVCVDVA